MIKVFGFYFLKYNLFFKVDQSIQIQQIKNIYFGIFILKFIYAKKYNSKNHSKLLSQQKNFACLAFQTKKLSDSNSELYYQSTSLKLEDPKFINLIPNNSSVYCGYDPTASSLHLGNLISILMMARLSLYGMKPIFLVGGATGMIGDPSGKSKERTLIQEQILIVNIKGVQNNLKNVFKRIKDDVIQNNIQYNIQSPLFAQQAYVNNSQFYQNMSIIDFLRKIGKNFRLSTLLGKESVSHRLNSEQGISFTQFSYSLLQAYDYLRLNQQYKCYLQIGGSDQWGNITTGCDLIKKIKGTQVYGITIPLLINQNGEKFGKSEGNSIKITQSSQNSYEIYQYLYNISDEAVQNLLYQFTFYPDQKIKQIMNKHRQNLDNKYAQSILAKKVSSYIGDFQNLNQQYFRLTYQQIHNKSQYFYQNLYKKLPQNLLFKISKTQLQEIDLAKFLTVNKIAKGTNQFRRDVQAGGFYINNRRIQKDEILQKSTQEIFSKEILYEKYTIIRWGKKKYNFIRWV